MSISKRILILAGAIVVALMILSGLYLVDLPSAGAVEKGDAVISYSTETVLNGSTQYTTTGYSSAYLVGNYAHAQVQASVSVTGTGTVTITPQFSAEPVGCSSVSDWVNAVEYATYTDRSTTTTITDVVSSVVVTATGSTTATTDITSTSVSETSVGSLVETSLAPQIVIASGGSGVRDLPILGHCMRFKMTTSGDYYTPTLYLRKVNR